EVHRNLSILSTIILPHHHIISSSFPTRRSSDLGLVDPGALESFGQVRVDGGGDEDLFCGRDPRRQAVAPAGVEFGEDDTGRRNRSEEHTSELQSRFDLVCSLLL